MSFEIKIGKYTITRDLVKTKVFYLFLAFINVVICVRPGNAVVEERQSR